jgi:FkbM family methyltransferase
MAAGLMSGLRGLFDSRHGQTVAGARFRLADLHEGSRDRREAIVRSLCMGTYLGNDTVLCRVLGRYKMLVDATDMVISPHLICDGFWEMWHTEVMARLLKPGMTAVDIGANLGYFTLLMADLVGPTGRVHAFEPNAAMAARLRGSLGINGFEGWATLHEMALGDRNGRARLLVPEGEPGGGHVVDRDYPGAMDVRLRSFDAMPELAQADYIKMDVEGAEPQVWAGMQARLRDSRPLTIVLEFTTDRYRDAPGFVDEFANAGFSLAVIDPVSGITSIDRETLLSKSDQEQLVILRR